MFLDSARMQSRNFECAPQRRQRERTCGPIFGLGACCNRRMPESVLEFENFRLLLGRPNFRALTYREIACQPIQVDPSFSIVLQYSLQVASFRVKKVEAIIGRA